MKNLFRITFLALLLNTLMYIISCTDIEVVDSPYWTKVLIEGGGTGRHTSLAMAENAYSFMAYFNETQECLSFATHAPNYGSPQIETFSHLGERFGWYASLVLDEFYRPFIASYKYEKVNFNDFFGDKALEALLLLFNGNKPCLYRGSQQDLVYINEMISVADIKAQFPDLANYLPSELDGLSLNLPGGLFTSLVLIDKSADTLALTYYQYDILDFFSLLSQMGSLSTSDFILKGLLKYAFSLDGGNTWQIITLDDEGDCGLYSSLKQDPVYSDILHVAYYESIQGVLKHIRFTADGNIVEKTIVDDTALTGEYASLDVYGHPSEHITIIGISYYDATHNSLKFAEFHNDSWHLETIDKSKDQNIGLYTSFKYDDSGQPHISYYDATGRFLKYAHRTTNGWFIENVDSRTASIGRYSSLDVKNGRVAITYYDAISDSLLLAVKSLSE